MRGAIGKAGLQLTWSSLVPYALTAGAVFLGWQVAVQPFVQRAPVALAVRLAPGSPTALGRAAEAELAAGRVENAAALGREALARSPFDVRALRLIGLSEAQAGRTAQADEILTLAGNWSLRDDPAHAWLVESRLRRGDYASAFAHADTLVRRREDIQPQIFRLFTLAGTEDPGRSLPVLAALLAAQPPWRSAFLNSLSETPQQLQLAVNLAIMLESSDGALANVELEQLYWVLVRKEQFQAVNALRQRTGRPSLDRAVTNGDFSNPEAPLPFQWRLLQSAGIASEIAADDIGPSNRALRVEYNGYDSGTVALQLVFLRPGVHAFTADVRAETSSSNTRLSWVLTCAVGSAVLGSVPAANDQASPGGWFRITGRFEIPSTCPAQWLRLETQAQDRRSPSVVWFDNVSVANDE